MSLHILDILSAAAGLLSFLTFFIHWMGNKKPSLPNLLFRAFLIANAYYFIIAGLFRNGIILAMPHLFRTGSVAGFVVTPLVYLILIKSLKKEPWKKIDYLHFVPAAFYIIDFIPFFILPAASKLEIIEHLIRTGDSATLGFGEGWIFSGPFWIASKVLQPIMYSFLCFVTLYQIIGNSGNSFKKENRRLIQLLYWLSIYLLLNAIPVGLSFAGLTGSDGWEMTLIIIFSSTLIICLFLLFNPEILYGLKGIWIIAKENDFENPNEGSLSMAPSSAIKSVKPALIQKKGSNISEAEIGANITRERYLSMRQVNNMEKVLSNYMHETQAYLQQGFSLPQLAKETNFQLQHVSAFLNQHMGENFNDYVNKMRVKHLISLYEQDPTIIDRFTLEYLGKESGFGSRSVFITSFKKFTGQTPLAYFKS